MLRRKFLFLPALAAIAVTLLGAKDGDGSRPLVSAPDSWRIPSEAVIVEIRGWTDGVQTTEYRWPRVELFPASGVNPSNYDATSITAIQGVKINDLAPVVGSKFAPGSPDNHWTRIDVALSVNTDVGHWDVHRPAPWGLANHQTETVLLNGPSEYYFHERLDNINLVQPPHFEGAITITYEFQDTVVTVDDEGRVLSVAAETRPAEIFRTASRPYDDGSYKATLQNLKALGPIAPAP